ncbi:hypothetical protein B0H16DRAFT_1472542 [Mycena metata]|uniref:Uncharacterized protein n=1 Tax=Mycena metata TaxID=1033252 RepID=A0AAD7MMB2_9AGAR|nr:hypothetical protein B0H16DRAFT_1472542 [Mycena metata]
MIYGRYHCPGPNGRTWYLPRAHRRRPGSQKHLKSEHQKGCISSIWALFWLPKGLSESPRPGLSCTGQLVNGPWCGIRWPIALVLGLLESSHLGLLVGAITEWSNRTQVWQNCGRLNAVLRLEYSRYYVQPSVVPGVLDRRIHNILNEVHLYPLIHPQPPTAPPRSLVSSFRRLPDTLEFPIVLPLEGMSNCLLGSKFKSEVVSYLASDAVQQSWFNARSEASTRSWDTPNCSLVSSFGSFNQGYADPVLGIAVGSFIIDVNLIQLLLFERCNGLLAYYIHPSPNRCNSSQQVGDFP